VLTHTLEREMIGESPPECKPCAEPRTDCRGTAYAGRMASIPAPHVNRMDAQTGWDLGRDPG
jgi:hypothetical protein